MELSEARRKIERAIEQSGPYSHNIVGFVLREVAKAHGTAKANALIDEYGIEDLYGIELQKEPRG